MTSEILINYNQVGSLIKTAKNSSALDFNRKILLGQPSIDQSAQSNASGKANKSDPH